MNMWTGREWNQIQGIMLRSEHNTGTVKDFVSCGVETNEKTPDFIKIKKHKFWEYDTSSTNQGEKTGEIKSQSCTISKMSRHEKKSKSKQAVNAVQQKRTKLDGQWQFIIVKQIQKELRQGYAVYFDLVLPKIVQPQGMIQ